MAKFYLKKINKNNYNAPYQLPIYFLHIKTILKISIEYGFVSSSLNGSPNGSYSLFQLEVSEVISMLKNLMEHTFVFFKRLLEFLQPKKVKRTEMRW